MDASIQKVTFNNTKVFSAKVQLHFVTCHVAEMTDENKLWIYNLVSTKDLF